MNFQQVQAQLNDVPSTFKRPDTQFLNWADALSAALARDTDAADATVNQVVNIRNAQMGWVDIWGLLFNIPRMANEANSVYLQRIIYTVTAGGGTPSGIAAWILAVWKVNCTVTENLPGVGYTLTFQSSLTTAQAQAIINSLAAVRPAGIPILAVYQQGSAMVLDTVNYADARRVTGQYLRNALVAINLTVPVSTNNATVILPTALLDDPTLNP